MTNKDFVLNAEWLDSNIERFYELTFELLKNPNAEELRKEIDRYDDMIAARLYDLFHSNLTAEQEWLFSKLEDDYDEISSYVRYNIRTS